MKFQLSAGESALLVSSDGERASVLSPVASPPGSTLRMRGVEDSRDYAIKVRTIRRDAEGRFLITGRWVSLSREQRVFLKQQSKANQGEPETPPLE